MLKVTNTPQGEATVPPTAMHQSCSLETSREGWNASSVKATLQAYFVNPGSQRPDDVTGACLWLIDNVASSPFGEGSTTTSSAIHTKLPGQILGSGGARASESRKHSADEEYAAPKRKGKRRRKASNGVRLTCPVCQGPGTRPVAPIFVPACNGLRN